MATTVTKYIDPGGSGDYLTIAAWVADNCGIGGTNFVSLDKVGKGVVRCTNGNAFTTGFTFPTSWTTDATRYPWLYVDPDYRPGGVYPAAGNLARLNWTATGSSQRAVSIKCNFARIEGLYVKVNSNYDTYGFNVEDQIAGSSDIRIEKCLVKGNVSAGYFIRGIRIDGANALVKVGGVVCHDMDTGDVACTAFQFTNGPTVYVHRVTCYNTRRGFNIGTGGATVVCKGCIVQGAVDGWDGTFDAASDYNCSDLSGDAPGSNSVVAELTFKNAAGGDFRLADSDTAVFGEGIDLSADTSYPVDDDIVSTGIFASPPDIGAFERLSGVGAITGPLPIVDGQASNDAIHMATGDITGPLPVVSGSADVDWIGRGAIVAFLPIVRGTATISEPELPDELADYETFPLSGGFPEFEGTQFATLQSPPDAGKVETSARDERITRQWTLRFSADSRHLDAEDVELLRAFHRDHIGGAIPFYVTRVLPIPRPYTAPTLGSRYAGTGTAQRTVEVGYTWEGVDGETTRSINTDTLAIPESHVLTVSVPRFPANVEKANVYVGSVSGTLYKQTEAISTSSGTWVEPSAGYATGTDTPPSTNTLTETVTARFRGSGYKLRKATNTAWEAEVYLEEVHRPVTRAYFGWGAITGPLPSVSGTATAPLDASGDIIGPLPTVSGLATYTPTQENAEGDIIGPLPIISGVATLQPPGDIFVAKTGSDSNDGSSGSPYLTVQKALNEAAPGETIIIQAGTYQQELSLAKPDLTIKGIGAVILDANGAYSALTSGGVSNRCQFYNLAFKGGYRAVYSTGDSDWALYDCEFYDANRYGLWLENGTRHRVIRSFAHDIGNNDEAVGVYLDKSSRCLVDSSVFQLIRKNGIRDKEGSTNVITHNFFQAVGSAISVHDDTEDVLCENNYGVYLANYGVVAKRFGVGLGYNRFIHNTFEEVADNCLALFQDPRYDGVDTDYLEARRNLLKCSSGSNFVLFDNANAGSHIIVDENMYWPIGSGPVHYWEYQGPDAGTADSVAAVYAAWGYEQNGTEYSAATVDNYGGSGYATPTELFTPLALTAIDASSNPTEATNTTDWTADTYWDSTGASNEWIVYDLGSVQTFEYAYHHPYAHKALYTAENIKVQTSNSDSGPWDDRVDDRILNGGSPTWWQFTAPVSARYVRFWMTDNYGAAFIRVPIFGVGNMI